MRTTCLAARASMSSSRTKGKHVNGIRRSLSVQLDPTAWPGPGLSPVNRAVVAAIVFSVALAIVESEPLWFEGHDAVFQYLELAVGLVFLAEYAARVWASVENPRYGPGLAGRLRYVRSPAALLDLLALSPLLTTMIGAEAYVLRLLRLMRVLRLAKLGRFSTALAAISDAVRSRRYELVTSVCIALVLLLLTSTLMYLVEGGSQPQTFGSIPRAMWWSISTLTTVGYGDAVPLTPVGKVLAGITAITGIGLIAMPTGILAAAFSDAMQLRRREAALPEPAGAASAAREGRNAAG